MLNWWGSTCSPPWGKAQSHVAPPDRAPLLRAILAMLVALATSAAAAASGPDGREDFRDRLPQDEIIYFLLPDRLETGDPANDRGGLEGDRLRSGFDPTSTGFYHGGDLKGLLARLDYIQGLGATALWLGPIHKNKAVQGAPGHQSAGPHR